MTAFAAPPHEDSPPGFRHFSARSRSIARSPPSVFPSRSHPAQTERSALHPVRRDPVVVHVIRRLLPHRTMAVKLRLRNRRHEVTVPRSCDIDSLKVAALAAFKRADPGAQQHEDLRLVFNGTVLDAANGLPVVEYGVDDGSVILAVPCVDRTREIAMRVKILGAPATTVKLPASSQVREVKRMVVTQLPADIIARYPQLPRWQVFLSRGGFGSATPQTAQRMADEETLALHRLEDAATILFLVPPAGMVNLTVTLGPVLLSLPDHKERLLGLDGCYKEQLEQCRKELKAQQAREAERERTEAEREARRARRLAKQQKELRSQKQAAQRPGRQGQDKSRSAESAPRKRSGGRGLARGFFVGPSSSSPAPSAPSSPTTSPEAVRPTSSHATKSAESVRPPPSWQLQQIQQQKKRRQQQTPMKT